MKKLYILSNLLILCLLANAQTSFSISEGQSVLVYSLPKTELCIEITTEKVTEKPGIFYRYSERYLATKKVVTDEKTIYNIKSINLKTQSVADPARTFSFVPTKKSNVSHLSVNKKGILYGINTPFVKEEKKEVETPKLTTMDVVPTDLLPLGEEYMMAGSEAKMAEGAAKQIYRIRESRMGILTADVEHLPADGSSFKTVMDGLNKLEKNLTELFIGKKTTEIISKKIYFTPSSATKDEVLFRLSAFNGIVSKDDLSGRPFYINVIPTAIPTAVSDSRAKKATPALYYIQPASTQISISDGLNNIYNEKLDIPQFGKVIPLSVDFVEQPNIKIKFDTKTGRLLSVE
ncbi:MAG: DUF4831 family protein [Paludibacter sp.]|nr:DUF4831 family protein [Paludibacter sp.]